MISLPRMVKQAGEGQFDRILEDVLRNGRQIPLQARMRLEGADTLPAAALGLALQRVTELTYRPSDAALTLLERLLNRQRPTGSFGSIAGTAVALAALHAALSQHDALPGARGSGRYMSRELEARAREAAAQATHFLVQSQDADALDDEEGPGGLIGEPIDTAIVLWQLGLDTRFTRAVRFEALMRAVEERGLRHDRVTGALLQNIAPWGAAEPRRRAEPVAA